MEYGMGVQSADGRLDKRRRRSAIRREAIKFTKIVSLVGIRHATDGRNSAVRRFVWFVWLVVGFGFAVYQIQDRIVHYCELPTVTVFKMIINESLVLPQVTICNENEIVTTKAQKLGFQNYTKQLEAKLTNLEAKLANDSIGKAKAESELNDFLDTFHDFSSNWKNMSKELAMTVDESIIWVTFDGVENKSLIEEVLTDRGHCFAFSTKNLPLNSTKAGSSSGLFLVLSVDRKLYDHGSNNFDPGYKILIHDADEIPRMKEGGRILKPGVITRVAVSLQDEHQLAHPFGKCKPDPDYNEENCRLKSNCESFFEICGCVTIDMLPLDEKCEKSFVDRMNSSNTEVPACSYAKHYNCTVVHRDKFLSVETNETDCPRQCNSHIYTPTLTVSSIPMLMNEASLTVQGDSQILDRIRVHVYYDDLSYMETTDQPEYQIFELLCDIGGALSLMLGATLLTVYEGGEFMLLFARDYLHLRLVK